MCVKAIYSFMHPPPPPLFFSFFFPSQAYLVDTGGGERFRTLTSNFYRNADAALLMYSVEDRYTFENLQEWIEDAQNIVDSENFIWALVGNKSDLGREVEDHRVKARCEQLSTRLSFFTSAKTGSNVIESLERVVTQIHRKRLGTSNNNAAPKKTSGLVNPVHSTTSTRTTKKCC